MGQPPINVEPIDVTLDGIINEARLLLAKASDPIININISI